MDTVTPDHSQENLIQGLAPGRKIGGEFQAEGHLYLSCNNSDETISSKSKLSPYHKKQAHIIYLNAEKFISSIGLNRVGFLTLTFADNVTDYKEASRRFNNLNRRFISEYFGAWCLVKEEQKRGAWHYHILIDCLVDIRTSFDFNSYIMAQQIREAGFKSGLKWKDYAPLVKPYEKAYIDSAPTSLRKIWRLMNESMANYGFGRCEMMPIQTTIEAAARYVGKYCSKHIENRSEGSKGIRLTAYSKGFLKSSTKFQWNTDGAKLWRKHVEMFTGYLGCKDQNALAQKLGAKWAFKYEFLIHDIENYTKNAVLFFIDSHSNNDPLKDHPGGRITVNPDDGFLLDSKTGEVLF